MSRNLRKIAVSLLPAFLLLGLSPLPSHAGGCGPGGMGYACQTPQRSMWDRTKGILYHLLPWAPMETASDLVSKGYNAYLKSAWGLQPYGFAEKALAGAGTFAIEAGMAGPGELANAARGGARLGAKALVNAARAYAASSAERVALRNAFTGAVRNVAMGEAGAVMIGKIGDHPTGKMTEAMVGKVVDAIYSPKYRAAGSWANRGEEAGSAIAHGDMIRSMVFTGPQSARTQLQRMSEAGVHNFVIVSKGARYELRVAPNIGTDPNVGRELGVKHIQLANNRPIMFGGTMRVTRRETGDFAISIMNDTGTYGPNMPLTGERVFEMVGVVRESFHYQIPAHNLSFTPVRPR